MSNESRFSSREGQRVPDVVFETREEGQWRPVSSDEIFEGRTVCVFALPGAFTPTCSSAHLPRYEELAERLSEAGVDEVVCVSVNDAFVMDAWGKEQGARRVRLIPDGNGDFTEGMGMLVPKRDLGFGNRSWRYSMLVRDGVIEKMFIEPDVEGDPYEVSDADTMLRYLRPETAEAEKPKEATLFTRPGCPYCDRAKALLEEHGIDYEEIVLGAGVTTRSLQAVTGRETVPQVYVDGQHIGGADELEAWLG